MNEVNVAIVDEQKEFDELIKAHFAQCSNVLRRYTDRLSIEDRNYFMAQSLLVGFEHRHEFSPKEQHIAEWWATICNRVSAQRREWRLRYSTHDEWVLGSKLGRQL